MFMYCFLSLMQTIHEELASHQHLVAHVEQLAEPLEAEAAEKAADIGVQWTQLESSLDRLSDCYGHAASDWMGIEAELQDIQQWCSEQIEWSQRSIQPGQEDQTLAHIQVTNDLHTNCLLDSIGYDCWGRLTLSVRWRTLASHWPAKVSRFQRLTMRDACRSCRPFPSSCFG